MLRPLPSSMGVGFCSLTPLDQPDYRQEKVDIYYNYHFTKQNWHWPIPFQVNDTVKIVDGFSPNLNKKLHIGHLRNLAIANAFSKMFPHWQFVALVGASLGVKQDARQDLARWFNFLDYHPQMFYDSLLPWDIVEYQDGPNGTKTYRHNDKDIITFRSNLVEWKCRSSRCLRPDDKNRLFYLREGDKVHICPICGLKGYEDNVPSCLDEGNKIAGRPTYVHHDLAFAKIVLPDYYITGDEQKDHFRNIGLGERHLPMGLVCGKDRTKLRSRTGDAPSAEEVFEEIKGKLIAGKQDKNPDFDKLTWNVICWNFLHCGRSKSIVYDPDKWTLVDSPGLYITYTYARIKAALNKIPLQYGFPPASGPITEGELSSALSCLKAWSFLTDDDVFLLGNVEYSHYYLARMVETMDTASLATYLLDLCRVLGNLYEREQIAKGRPSFQAVVMVAMHRLEWCMNHLGMFPLEEV